MASTTKILGQSAPSANTNTVLYTVPAATTATGMLVACNQNDKPVKIHIACTKSGNTLASKDYFVFQKVLYANETFQFDGLCLDTGDFVTVRSTKATVSFNLIGTETA